MNFLRFFTDHWNYNFGVMNKIAVLFLSAVIFFSSCDGEEEQFADPMTRVTGKPVGN
jgi:hypothetical protein